MGSLFNTNIASVTDAFRMETSYLEAIMTSSNGNIFRVTGHLCGEFTSPHKGQWRGALMFSLICVWINGRVNNREAGDLRRYRVHYDVIIMGSDHDSTSHFPNQWRYSLLTHQRVTWTRWINISGELTCCGLVTIYGDIDRDQHWLK